MLGYTVSAGLHLDAGAGISSIMKLVPGTRNAHYLPLLFSPTPEKSQYCAKCKLEGEAQINDSRVHNPDLLITSWIHTEMVLSFSRKHKGNTMLDQVSSFCLDHSMEPFCVSPF